MSPAVAVSTWVVAVATFSLTLHVAFTVHDLEQDVARLQQVSVTPAASVSPQPQATPTRASRSRPTQAPRSTPAQSRPARSPLNWHALAQCESTNNPRAVSPSGRYRGLYQFSLTTWRSVGGTGDPINATRAEQTHRAQLLYACEGRTPWPECGGHL